MLNKIKAFFEAEIQGDMPEMAEENKRLACAALLIEVAVIDQNFDNSEFDALQGILQTQFNLSAAECETLTSLARTESEESTSMYQFTQLVNQYCSNNDKFELLVNMWKIAYADGNLDKYEEYIIRKVSDLIYMAHGDFIRAKHAARDHYT